MAEALKGDTTITVDDQEYTFRFGGSALMAIEEAFPGETFIEVLKRFGEQGKAGAIKVAEMAALARCGLKWHHPDIALDEAAEVVFSTEGGAAMSAAIMLAFPQGGDGNADANPPMTPNNRRGTGTTRSGGGSRRAAKA